ncbi:MAG: DUF2059 domain-containing protein [Brevundimonas sp.]|nr:MAG: DUF2059 domain-containing protein [Brevundimonas sp.]
MMRFIGILLAVALAFGAATAAQADDDAARRLALAREFVELSQGENLEKQIRESAEAQLGRAPGLTEEQNAWMRETGTDILTRLVVGMIDDVIQIVADTYTLEELQAQVDFYRTPIGRAIASKSFDMGVRQGQVLARMQMAFVQELIGKYCAEFTCPGAATPGPAVTPRKPS